MTTKRISRRAILRGTGGTMIALPLLEAMGDPLRGRAGVRQAGAAEGGTPKRFVVFYMPTGTYRPKWRPTGTEKNFSLSYILEPLAPYQQDIVIPDGLELSAGKDGKLAPGHGQGVIGNLTGASAVGGSNCGLGQGGGGISVDQEIAKAVGTRTKFRSLNVGAGEEARGNGPFNSICYYGKGQPVPHDVNPFNVFKRLFSDVVTDPAALSRLRAQQRSVLDTVADSFRRLAPKISGDDRKKIEDHQSTIRDVEMRLDNLIGTGPVCGKPNLGTAIDVDSVGNYPAVMRLQMDLMVMALTCDLTRVSTLKNLDSNNQMEYTWLGFGGAHHVLSHSGDNDTSAWDKYSKINRWYIAQFAYLVGKLKGVREGAGTLLDNTLAFFTSCLGKPNAHLCTNMPFVLAGRAGGALTTGRYLAYNQSPNERILHGNLLVSFLNLFDIPAKTFGNPEWCTGPLPRLVS